MNEYKIVFNDSIEIPIPKKLIFEPDVFGIEDGRSCFIQSNYDFVLSLHYDGVDCKISFIKMNGVFWSPEENLIVELKYIKENGEDIEAVMNLSSPIECNFYDRVGNSFNIKIQAENKADNSITIK